MALADSTRGRWTRPLACAMIPRSGAGVRVITCEQLLERESELAEIAVALETASSGQGRLVVIEGAAGLGKTCLLQAALEGAGERGLTALRARGTDLERDFPFGVVRQLLEPQLAALSAAEREALFTGAAALARPLFGSSGDASLAAPTDPGYGTLHGLYWLVSNLAERSTVVVSVDDIQWADASSLRFLAFLLPRLQELPLALLVAVRREGADASPLISQLAAEAQAVRLTPRPLSVDAVSAVLRASFGRAADREFAQACEAATAGNPFFLEALLHELSVDDIEPTAAEAVRVRSLGPPAVSRAVLMRLTAVPGGPALARALAVLGDGAPLRDAAALAGLDERSAADAAGALVHAAILKRAGRLEFVHPIVRQAVYKDLAPHERATRHAHAARLLDGGGAPAERVATQLLATDPANDGWVLETLRSAARDANRRGASESAVRYLQRALAESPAGELRGEVLLELGQAEVLGRMPEAIGHLTEAAELVSDSDKRAAAGLALGRTLAMLGRAQECAEAFRRTLDRLDAEERELRLTLEAEMLLSTRLSISARPQLPPRRLAELRREADPASSPAERALMAYLANEALLMNEPAWIVCELAERALGGGRLLAERSADSPLYFAPVVSLLFADGFKPAEAALEAALGDARARGSALAFTMASCFRSELEYRLGRLADAEADGRRALEFARRHGWQFGLPNAIAVLANPLIERGELEAAAELLEREDLDRVLEDVGGPVSNWLYQRGRVRVLRGLVEEGLSDMLACGRREEAWGCQSVGSIPWRSGAALTHAALGERVEAVALADEELRLARASGAPRALGIALRARGLVEGGAAGVEWLCEATSVLERSAAVLEHARALLELGAALRRENHRRQAREPLTRALERARACGARVLLERAEEELAATGARPRRTALSGVESLTASERRIAQMAAEGRTNREIAQALFVTQKTVEMHLSNAYRKLDIRSRSELPATLATERKTPNGGTAAPTEAAGPAKP